MNRPTWQQDGEDPDYRFSLANERTFLAWIRTALALLASSVALDQFASHAERPYLMPAIAWVLSIAGTLLAAWAYAHWRKNEIAMRHGGPLPPAIGIPILTIAIGGVAGMLALGLSAKWL
ncbi:DUF202 domain-containing protein [Cupriavidus plantarum]|uniref:DUF202 domain-containing protein n=1 Tax=Cupriavidus plantarum TaxID=942865 RepID=UPI0015CBDF0A|nr:putative membrane protein [Cupriavidus plantarum]